MSLVERIISITSNASTYTQIIKFIQHSSIFIGFLNSNSKKDQKYYEQLARIFLDARLTYGLLNGFSSLNSLCKLAPSDLNYNYKRLLYWNNFLCNAFTNIDFYIRKNMLRTNKAFAVAADKLSGMFWLGGAACSIALKCKELNDEDKATNKRKKLEIFISACEIPLAINCLNISPYLIGANMSRGLVGVAGMLSAGTSIRLNSVKI